MATPLNVFLKLQRIICYDEDDGFGNAEPYLWAVFFKIDSDKAVLTIKPDASPPLDASSFFVDGTATVQGNSGNHGNLGANDTWEGRDIPIPPAVGEFRTTLNPLTVAGLESFGQGGAVGCLILLLEEDGTSSSAVASGHTKLNQKFEEVLNGILPDLDLANPNVTPAQRDSAKATLKKEIEDEIWKNTRWWELLWPGTWDSDDQIGFELFVFTLDEIVNAGTDGKTFGIKWDNEGSWEIQGQIIGSLVDQPDLPSTTPTNPGTCFVATAAAGSPDDAAVIELRKFRDEVLRQSVFGNAFIRLYELVGPSLAKSIQDKEWARRIVYRRLIQPIARIVKTKSDRS